ncbi:MAG TPA: hypothetical protein PKC28_07650 [Bdellovibrionales bacterium]|nr:hypothetical protein [Bdellovibrionales bacterium]
MNALRILIPSWRFFDDLGAVPRLEIREDGGEWRAFAYRAPAFSWSQLFFNPTGNLNHAIGNLLNRLMLEDEPGHTPTYALVEALARESLGRDTSRFQFRLMVTRFVNGEMREDERLTSPELPR